MRLKSHNGPVAQRIEQLISNQLAAGSIPAGVTLQSYIDFEYVLCLLFLSHPRTQINI